MVTDVLRTINDDIVLYYGNDPTGQKYPFFNNGAGIRVVCYDYDTNEIEYITTDAMRDYVKTNNANLTDKVFFRRYWGNLKEMFVYRNAR